MELRGVEDVERSDGLEDDFNPATRLAVDGGIAATCIGGRLTGLAFLGSVDDNVYNTVRNILVNTGGHTNLSAFPPHEDRNTTFASFFFFLFQLRPL